ncbi:MAG TPA: ABC transporter ATP-binding protein [Caldithrix sp.]|nr:ABC transporter ATP-binding protein [Caldithrix sp.]
MNQFSIQNISKSFDGIRAVDDFSFEWKEHSIVGLIGPNGAGKTTLFNIITGFLPADSGSFLFNGKNIFKLPPHQIVHDGLARTFQDLRLLRQITVEENLLLCRLEQVGENPWAAWMRGKRYDQNQQENRAKIKEILQFIGLWEKRNDLAEALSYGQQKLLSLGCCLVTEADYLLLDEPVSGVNPTMIEKILQLLQELASQGKRILLIEHNIGAVRSVCDWLVVMDEGKKIAEGLPGEVLQKEEIVEAYLD